MSVKVGLCGNDRVLITNPMLAIKESSINDVIVSGTSNNMLDADDSFYDCIEDFSSLCEEGV